MERPKNPFETSGRTHSIAAGRGPRAAAGRAGCRPCPSAQRLRRSAGSAPAGEPPLTPPAAGRATPPGAKAAPPETALALLSVTTPGAAHRDSLSPGHCRAQAGRKPGPPPLNPVQHRCRCHRPLLSPPEHQPGKQSTPKTPSGANRRLYSSPGPVLRASRTHPATPPPQPRPDRAPGSPRSVPTAPTHEPATPNQMTRELRAASPPRGVLPSPHVILPALSAASPSARAFRGNIAISPPPPLQGGPGDPAGPAGRGPEKRREASPPFSGARNEIPPEISRGFSALPPSTMPRRNVKGARPPPFSLFLGRQRQRPERRRGGHGGLFHGAPSCRGRAWGRRWRGWRSERCL